jgi:hypothetical protein
MIETVKERGVGRESYRDIEKEKYEGGKVKEASKRKL